LPKIVAIKFLRHSVDAVYCYRPSSVVCQSVGQSITLVRPAKMAEAIKMPFGLRTPVDEGTMY